MQKSDRLRSIERINFTQPAGWRNDYFQRFYASDPKFKDRVCRHQELLARVLPEGEGLEALELGAGPTNNTSKKMVEWGFRITGLDIDPAVKTNEHLAEAHIYDGRNFPLRDGSFSVAYSCDVDEHVEHPHAYLREIHRVLKPGGVYVSRTSNLGNYKFFLNYLLPVSVGNWLAKMLIGTQRDRYPAFYRMNRKRRIRQLAAANGFEVLEIFYVEANPSYLQFARIPFLIGVGIERFINHVPGMQTFASNIYFALRKKAEG